MTPEQIYDAIRQMRSFVRGREDAYKEGIDDYIMVSAREVLYTLGYSGDESDEVLTYVHENGFNYCLDTLFPVKNEKGEFERTPEFATYWGIDQLRSRLDCVYIPGGR